MRILDKGIRHSVAPIVEVKSIEKCPIEMFLKK